MIHQCMKTIRNRNQIKLGKVSMVWTFNKAYEYKEKHNQIKKVTPPIRGHLN